MSPFENAPFKPRLPAFADGPSQYSRMAFVSAVTQLQEHFVRTRSRFEIELDGLSQNRKTGILSVFDGSESHHFIVKAADSSMFFVDGEPYACGGPGGPAIVAAALIKIVEIVAARAAAEAGAAE